MRKFVLGSMLSAAAIAVGAMPAMAQRNFNPSGLVDNEWAIYGSQTCGIAGTAKFEIDVRIEPSNPYDLVGKAEFESFGKLIGTTQYNGVRFAQVMFIQELYNIQSFYVGWVRYNEMNWLPLDCD